MVRHYVWQTLYLTIPIVVLLAMKILPVPFYKELLKKNEFQALIQLWTLIHTLKTIQIIPLENTSIYLHTTSICSILGMIVTSIDH